MQGVCQILARKLHLHFPEGDFRQRMQIRLRGLDNGLQPKNGHDYIFTQGGKGMSSP